MSGTPELDRAVELYNKIIQLNKEAADCWGELSMLLIGGLSPEAFGKAIGVQPGTVSQWKTRAKKAVGIPLRKYRRRT